MLRTDTERRTRRRRRRAGHFRRPRARRPAHRYRRSQTVTSAARGLATANRSSYPPLFSTHPRRRAPAVTSSNAQLPAFDRRFSPNGLGVPAIRRATPARHSGAPLRRATPARHNLARGSPPARLEPAVAPLERCVWRRRRGRNDADVDVDSGRPCRPGEREELAGGCVGAAERAGEGVARTHRTGGQSDWGVTSVAGERRVKPVRSRMPTLLVTRSCRRRRPLWLGSTRISGGAEHGHGLSLVSARAARCCHLFIKNLLTGCSTPFSFDHYSS